MKLDSAEKLFRKKTDDLPREFWANCVEHVKKIEQSYRESDKIQDVQVEKLVIALKGNDSSDSDSETSLSAEESDDNLHDMSKRLNYINGKVHSLSSGKGNMFLCAACHAFTPHVNAWKNSIGIVVQVQARE